MSAVICLQVNGHNVTNVADDTAMTILRSSPRRLSMTLGRAVTNLIAPPSCDSLPDIVLHKTPSGQLGGGQNDIFTHILKAEPQHQYCFNLISSLRVSSPGIKLTGGIGSKWQGIYCLEVVPGSPASEEGSVQPSDKILYICGRCTLGMTLEDAVKACEAAPRKVKLKILRCVATQAAEISADTDDVVIVVLYDYAVFVYRREDQPVTPRAKWNGKSL